MAGEGDGERLELCAALPPDERTPETRALVAAARLCQEIEALLPLTPDGAAARADAAAARSAALQAMAKVALADYLCPASPPRRADMLNRLGAYMHCIRPAAAPAAGAEGGADGSGGGGDGAAATTAADREALAQVLRLYLTASQLQGDFEGLSVAAEASALLASPDQQAAVGRALAQLSSGGAVAGEAAAEAAGGHSADEQQDPWQQQYEQYEQGLPTLAQLRYACAHLAAEAALQVGALAAAPPGEAARLGLQAPAPLTPARREAVQAAEDGSIQQLLELDAGNPKGLLVAALASDRPGQPPARAAGVHLSVHRLALEQGSDWWAVLAASLAFALAAKPAADVDRATLADALATYRGAAPALERCRARLPQEWLQHLEAPFQAALPLVPAALARLRLGAGGAAGACGAAEAPGCCDACGAEAAELLRCSRCRAAFYCSAACQRAAWTAGHKQVCGARAAD